MLLVGVRRCYYCHNGGIAVAAGVVISAVDILAA